MTKTAKITVHPDYRIAEVHNRLFGAFLEPIVNWVYGGIWNPGHPMADDMGFRRDMIDLLKELGMPAVRLPGGNFISAWEWKDSIGPVSERKAHLDLAWRQIESNNMGHDEYLEWARRAGVEAMYTLNLGTADVQSALHCAEYTSHPGGTYWSDLRRRNGYERPHDVNVWYLGNEMDTPWQMHSYEKDPVGYGIKAHETSKLIKWINPHAETVVCGSSTLYLPGYPEWERRVLEQCYETTDYLSLHYYHYAPEGDIAAYMSTSDVVEDFLRTEIAVCDYVQAKNNDPRKMMISFDEFGTSFHPQRDIEVGRRGRIPHEAIRHFTPEKMYKPIEAIDPGHFSENPPAAAYSEHLWALAMSSVFMVLLRHADRVKIGCVTAGIRNAIAYDAAHVWKAAGFYPYAQLIKYSNGVSLMPAVDGPTFSTKAFNLTGFYMSPAYEGLQCIEAAAVHDRDKGEVTLFMINRDENDDIEVDVDARGFDRYRLIEHSEMYTNDLYAGNSYDSADITPMSNSATRMESGRIKGTLKKLSWNVIRLGKAK